MNANVHTCLKSFFFAEDLHISASRRVQDVVISAEQPCQEKLISDLCSQPRGRIPPHLSNLFTLGAPLKCHISGVNVWTSTRMMSQFCHVQDKHRCRP